MTEKLTMEQGEEMTEPVLIPHSNELGRLLQAQRELCATLTAAGGGIYAPCLPLFVRFPASAAVHTVTACTLTHLRADCDRLMLDAAVTTPQGSVSATLALARLLSPSTSASLVFDDDSARSATGATVDNGAHLVSGGGTRVGVAASDGVRSVSASTAAEVAVIARIRAWLLPLPLPVFRMARVQYTRDGHCVQWAVTESRWCKAQH